MIERRWISIKEAAQYLGIHYVTAYRMAIRGLLPAVKVGGIIRIDKKQLDSWLESQIENKVHMRKW